ncbi:MAG: hypothetical protein AB9866_07165 [Syntrophobacteraceae bacterium]
MSKRCLNVFIVALLACLLSSFSGLPVSQVEAAPVTEITVTSTEDSYLDGQSKTCLNSSPCTLRRAVNQAYSLDATKRPVLISFNIPTSDPGYISALKAWKIKLTGSTSYDLRGLSGKTTINGATQPNGRTNGPKIIIDAQNITGNKKNKGLILTGGENVVSGLAMQKFQTHHVSVSSDNNTVKFNWFGLSDSGKHLSAGDDVTREGGSGVVISNSNSNTIRNNVFAGFFGASCGITGNNNSFTGNMVGTRADGTVPLPDGFTQHPCQYGAWVGGSGITVAGTNNKIGGALAAQKNRFTGIFLDLSATATQPPAIWAQSGGGGHLVQNNIFGVDSKNVDIGVCGRGLDMGNGPKNMKIKGNVFAETRLSAIVMNSPSLNGNTLTGNVIRRKTPWPGPQGTASFSEAPIAYGPLTPAALKNFTPARVTNISGLVVSGTSGTGTPCPGCDVEIFLDDNDGITEALKSLGTTTANSSGNWSISMASPLAPGNGVRAMSTVPDTFTIAGLYAGTTSNLSPRYIPPKPKISITATDSSASEPGTNTGKFKITRTGGSGGITVRYSVTGTAKAGVDYVALPTSVKLEAGVNSKVLTVTPIDNTSHEVKETVIVTISESANYDRLSPYKATVNITDNE